MTIALVLGLAGAASGQVSFEGLDLNRSSELLFTAVAEVPQFGQYETLFLGDIPRARLRQLTFFPERLTILGNSGTIQLQNRFGVFRSVAEDPVPAALDTEDGDTAGDGNEPADDAETDLTPPRPALFFEPVADFPAFVDGEDIQTGKILGIAASPDGRFLSYLTPTSPGYGDLKIYDISRNAEILISRRVELSVDRAPLRWSGDSSFFIYARGGQLFYYSIRQYTAGRTLSEQLRTIGTGTIESVRWDDENTLYYVRGSLVYRINGLEFFTRSLYQDLLTIGSVAGKLPYAIDPNFDRFWISPDGEKILLSKDGRSVNVLFLSEDDYLSTGDTISLPYLYLPRNTRVLQVLWSDQDMITLVTGSIRHGEYARSVYRLDLTNEETRSRFEATADEDVLGVSLSPNGTRALVWTSENIEVRDYQTWENEVEIEYPGVIHALWESERRIVVGGSDTIERIDLGQEGNPSTLLAFSQVERYGYNRESAAIEVETGGRQYRLGEEGWEPADELNLAEPGVASEDYRVYMENLSSGSYRNMVMVRNVSSFGTVPLFPRPQRDYEAFPTRDDTINFTNFSHGSRIRRREVAFVFNAIDSVTGLTEILNTLAQYDIRATFFVNGDFIRRHPGAVQEIAESGHEVGSLFYTHFDMASGRFQINGEFIKQGLARNEDEYFETTGRELSLFWHAPYYFVNPEIISASREMNYAYIGRDVDSLDWVPRRDESGLSRLYRSTADIIEAVIEEKRPGSIVAMTVGRPGDDSPDGGRRDYLFHRLDVLINGLIERGYEIVPVSTLMEHAR